MAWHGFSEWKKGTLSCSVVNIPADSRAMKMEMCSFLENKIFTGIYESIETSYNYNGE